MCPIVELLLVFQFPPSSDGRLDCGSRSNFHAGATVPDPHSLPLRLGFATGGASVLGVLADLTFLTIFLREAPYGRPIH